MTCRSLCNFRISKSALARRRMSVANNTEAVGRLLAINTLMKGEKELSAQAGGAAVPGHRQVIAAAIVAADLSQFESR